MQNTKNSFKPASYIKILSLLHLGIMATPAILGVFFYFQIPDAHLSFTNSDDIFLTLTPIIAIGSIFLGDLLFRKMIKSMPKNLDLKEKLIRYRRACIIKYGLFKGAALFSIVIFHNTQNLIYLFIGLFLIFYLFLQKPTKDKIQHLLNLQGVQKEQFNRLNEPID